MKRFVFLPTLMIAGSFFLFGACSDPASAEDGVLDQEPGTIVDVAVGVNEESGEFSTLIAALQRAELVGALQTDEVLTVFAPTDAAFASLLNELGVSGLDDVDDQTLTAVLLYHVAPGRLLSGQVLTGEEIETLNGGVISARAGEPTLVDANERESNILVGAGLFDIEASNGVIHVIDRVLLP